MQPHDLIHTLRVSDRDLEFIISDLERSAKVDGSDLRRSLKRWKFTAGKAIFTLMRDMGPSQSFVVAPRNLSAGGVGLIHGSFVHANTRCVLSLRRSDGFIVHLQGTVVRCSHVRASLHDIGIAFDDPIEPQGFVDRPEGSRFNVERVDLKQLTGTLLVIEDSIADQRLIAHYFEEANLDVRFARNAAGAQPMLADGPDIVFVDQLLPDGEGIAFIRAARARSFAGPMLLLTADTSPGIRERARQAGAAEVLIKPCPRELLHQAAAEYLVRIASSSELGHGLVLASATATGIPLEMLESYVENLRRTADEILRSIGGDDFDGLRRQAIRLKGNADSYGFAPIGRAAADLLRMLNATMSVEESALSARRLTELCRRARSIN